MSKKNEAMLLANKLGYTVINGDVFSPSKKLRQHIDKNGYYKFSIRLNGTSTPVSVHRLVAYQKYGDAMFESGIEVRHLDNDRKNNLEDNIVIGTHQDNMLDVPKEIRVKRSAKAARVHDHEKIIQLYNEGYSYNKIMEELSITSKGTISHIIRKSLASSDFRFV